MNTASLAQLDHIGTRAAAMVTAGQRVGLGSGKAALTFVRALGARVRDEKLPLIGVPTSVQTEQVARAAGIPLGTLYDVEALDITVDGADEVDPELNLIKGGGGYLTREKVVASITRRLVIVVGGEKIVPQLGSKFPIFLEVLEFARAVVTRRIEAMGAVVTLRKNADGTLYQTDNGNPYLHCQFPPGGGGGGGAAGGGLADVRLLDRALHHMPGIIETALFLDMAHDVLVAHADGRVEHHVRGGAA